MKTLIILTGLVAAVAVILSGICFAEEDDIFKKHDKWMDRVTLAEEQNKRIEEGAAKETPANLEQGQQNTNLWYTIDLPFYGAVPVDVSTAEDKANGILRYTIVNTTGGDVVLWVMSSMTGPVPDGITKVIVDGREIPLFEGFDINRYTMPENGSGRVKEEGRLRLTDIELAKQALLEMHPEAKPEDITESRYIDIGSSMTASIPGSYVFRTKVGLVYDGFTYIYNVTIGGTVGLPPTQTEVVFIGTIPVAHDEKGNLILEGGAALVGDAPPLKPGETVKDWLIPVASDIPNANLPAYTRAGYTITSPISTDGSYTEKYYDLHWNFVRTINVPPIEMFHMPVGGNENIERKGIEEAAQAQSQGAAFTGQMAEETSEVLPLQKKQ